MSRKAYVIEFDEDDNVKLYTLTERASKQKRSPLSGQVWRPLPSQPNAAEALAAVRERIVQEGLS